MENMTLGTLPFICGPGPVQPFGITLDPQIEGLDATDYRIVEYPMPGQDGAVVSQAFYDARTITLSGIISGQTPTQYMQNRLLLSQATGINRDNSGYPVLTQLSFQTLDGNQFFIMVQPKKPTFDFGNTTWTKFQLPLLAPDPRIYGVSQQNSGQITVLVGGGFIVPVVVPVVSSGSSGGSALVTNSGTTDSHPILTLVGPLTNPYVQNQTTGLAFQLDTTIPAGSSVIVDMYHKTVTLNGSSLISNVDPLSSWWTIVPGTNNIVLSTSSSGDGGYVEIQFYSAFAGL